MKLFIKRNISPSDLNFTVFDELGKEKYFVKFQKAKTPVRFFITDKDDNVMVKIRRLPIVGTNTFVFKAGKKHLTFVELFTKNGMYCYFYGNNWHITGDVMSKNFSIIDVDNSVISSQKKDLDNCELVIFDSTNELYCVATSICVSMINTVDNLAAQAV